MESFGIPNGMGCTKEDFLTCLCLILDEFRDYPQVLKNVKHDHFLKTEIGYTHFFATHPYNPRFTKTPRGSVFILLAENMFGCREHKAFLTGPRFMMYPDSCQDKLEQLNVWSVKVVKGHEVIKNKSIDYSINQYQ